MSRRSPRTLAPRSLALSRRAQVFGALSSVLVVVCCVILSALAGAEQVPGVDGAPVGTVPISVGRPGAVSADMWSGAGLMVPVLLGLTAVLLAGGITMLWLRCRAQARAVPVLPGEGSRPDAGR